jgi:tripartite-type tricarboxylate transporter receptor subunit TctC
MTPCTLRRPFGAFIACTLVPALSAYGQNFPERPIRFIVPYPPGGSTDILARVVAPRMSETWGQPVVIDNRPGATGNIGCDLAAKAPPDGYTIVVTSMSQAIGMSYHRKLSYDLVRDLQAVSLFATQPNVLIVAPSLPARSIQELVALAKAKPGQLAFGSPGNGSSQHLMGEFLEQSTRADLLHVSYKGTALVLNDVIGGQIAMMFSPLIQAIPQMKSGKVRALAVTSAKRAAAAPDVPTMIESGVPGYDVVSWYGVHTASKVPRAPVNTMNREINRILALREVHDRLSGLGMEPAQLTADQFNELVKSEVARWGKILKDAGIKPE